MIQAASERTPGAIADTFGQEITRQIEQRLSYYAAHKDEISQRLWELDREWDVEQFMEVGVSSVTLAGLALATIRARRWLLLLAVAAGFSLQHTLLGGSPILPLLHKLGVRTRSQIEQERYALKILRGDFQISDIEGKSDLERVASILRSVTQR